MTVFVLLLISSYLLGSVSNAIVICRVLHLPDPRTIGSGNPGATNVLRLAGKMAGVVVLLGDVLKGLLPVVIGNMLGYTAFEVGFVGVAVVLGHVFPLYYRFQGGKGVATLLGVLLATNWLFLGLSALFIMGVLIALFRYVSLASIVMAASMPFIGLLIDANAYPIPLGLIALLVLYRHKDNIKRLLQGTENKLNF